MASIQQTYLSVLKKLAAQIPFDRNNSNNCNINPGFYRTFVTEAQTEVASRRGRRKLFEQYDLFADPAWDILLELFIADANETKLSVTAIGLETGVASTTVIRWISVLENHSLVRRVADSSDKRRYWVYLTNKGKEKMQQYFKNDMYIFNIEGQYA